MRFAVLYYARLEGLAEGLRRKKFGIITGDRSSIEILYFTLPKLYKRAIGRGTGRKSYGIKIMVYLGWVLVLVVFILF